MLQEKEKTQTDQPNDLDLLQAEQAFITARTNEEAASGMEHANRVYELSQAAQLILNSYKQEVEEFRQEVASLKPTTEVQQKEVNDIVNPKAEYFKVSLEKGKNTQNEINKIFQLSMSQLKKEDQELQQQIIKLIDRIQKQEAILGSYKKK